MNANVKHSKQQACRYKKRFFDEIYVGFIVLDRGDDEAHQHRNHCSTRIVLVTEKNGSSLGDLTRTEGRHSYATDRERETKERKTSVCFVEIIEMRNYLLVKRTYVKKLK